MIGTGCPPPGYRHETTAIPPIVDDAERVEHGPKTLRDEFAMVALRVVDNSARDKDVDLTPTQVAEDAYEIADAMMEARKK